MSPVLVLVLMIDTLAWIFGAIWLVTHDHPVFGALFIFMAGLSTLTLTPKRTLSK
jgi:hypothetical protein